MDNNKVYIDDVAKRTARTEAQYKNLNPDKEIDLTIVVARLLTGFDAPRLNTLYLDKLLQYQGLIQAFARTNRVYDKNKSQGNIVMFRRPKLMKERTEDAFEKYAGEGSFKKVFRPEFPEMENEFKETINDLKKFVPTSEDANDLTKGSDEDKIEFLTRFRSVAKKMQYIASYSDFNWDEHADKYGMTSEEYGYYQGAYENVKVSLKDEPGEGKDDISLKYDFDDIVISELLIDKEYVLNLATKFLLNTENLFAEDEFNKAADKLAKSGHHAEVDDIRDFVIEEKKRGDIPADYDARATYAIHQNQKKERKISKFVNEYGLDVNLFNRLVTEYEATGEFGHEQDLKQTADIKVAESNGHEYRNILDFKGSVQRAWRTFIKDDLALYDTGEK